MSFFVDQHRNIVFITGGEEKNGLRHAEKDEVVEYCINNFRFYRLNKDEIDGFVGKSKGSKIKEARRKTKQELLEAGFNYKGQIYSATNEDQMNLISASVFIERGVTQDYEIIFSNGAKLSVNNKNIQDFMKRWNTFRKKIIK